MKRFFFSILLASLFLTTAQAQPLNGYEVQFVNEWGRPVNMTTSVSLYIYAVGTTSELSVYKTEAGGTACTQPITDDSTLSPLLYTTGLLKFFTLARSWKIYVTDGTYTRTLDNCNESTTRIMWPTFGLATAGTSLGQNDDVDFTFGAFIMEGDVAGQVELRPDADGGVFKIGTTTENTDMYWYAGASAYIFWDEGNKVANFTDIDATFDAGNVGLGDGDKLTLGDPGGTGDLYLESTSTVLTLGQVVSGTGSFVVGVDNKGIDTTFYGEAASSYMKWDQDGATNGALLFDAASLALGDGDKILLGDTLGTGDFSISDESDVLSFRQIVADTGTVAWGVDNAGIDQTWYGESASAYMKWDATSADQLQIVGVDSSGTVLAITGVDTSGNSDTVTIAHSGTGAALQINSSAATTQLIELISAANQTTWLQVIDGAAGNWIGADNVGMLTLKGDTAGTHTGTSLLNVQNSAQPITSAEGFLARFVDTGTARTTAYAVEIETTNTTPALMLNNQMTISGADSAGVLFDITAIDTTGNSDTMQIAHSGTGDALQITCTEADSVALNLVAATSQTTAVLRVDGATGSWLGADGVGMINLSNDGALAHVNSSLLYINNTGVPQDDSRGSSLRIVDSGNAAAGTAGYAVYISATDATVEALYIDDGNVLIDESLTVTGNINRVTEQYVQTVGYCKVGTTAGWVIPAAADAAHLATLPQSQTASTLVIPITIPLKVGWTITAWTINGQIDSAGNIATLDGRLYKHTEATAGFANAAIGSGMAQLSKTADYKVVEGEASLTEVVAADESYYLLVTGTTAATTDIEIASITVTVTEI